MKLPFVIIPRKQWNEMKKEQERVRMQLAGLSVIIDWMKQQKRKEFAARADEEVEWTHV